ncbi:MAG TPA: hypothetical protein VEB19_11985 [Gemmatimonadaceae bacterium]|nr:hypothetical protein [Gemmatimonadaceae bacterium]
MSPIGTFVAAAVLAVVPVPGAGAQDAPQPATECAVGASAAYVRCALWIDGARIRRGSDGAIVAQPGFFRPPRLARLVQGDSAVHYGRSFERNSSRSLVFGVISGLLLGTAWVVADQYNCNPESMFGICTNNDDDEALTIGLLALGSLASGITSGVFQVKARRAGARSVFWHNANFAR